MLIYGYSLDLPDSIDKNCGRYFSIQRTMLVRKHIGKHSSADNLPEALTLPKCDTWASFASSFILKPAAN